ncbi:glutamate--cysteine ligase [Streptomyces sp. HMX112]|uniref:carboxylate-amine ligase n=1 Tax=Streptomyces sp. HMX112 TaxID=3390850 RepID=UPI003A80CDEA
MGVEEEFHVVDVESGVMVDRAGSILSRLPGKEFTAELHRSVVESNSGVHASLEDLHTDLLRSRRLLDAAAARQGLAVAAAGTVPLGHPRPRGVTADDRYAHMADEYRRLVDEQLICGAQVHVDVPDRDTAVRVMCAVSPWLPVLLALSASSPFWLGSDTGYASWRTMVWQRWPTAGPAGCFGSAAEYDATLDELVRSGVISDPGMVYYDVRPSAHLGTLELRISDACPRAETVVLLAGLFRALVTDATARLEDGAAPCACGGGRREWLRTATWRAARSGLEGDLIDPVTRMPAPASTVVRDMVRHLRPALEACGDWQTVSDLAERALADGSAAHRLRRVAHEEDLLACVDLITAETRGGSTTGSSPAPAPSAPSFVSAPLSPTMSPVALRRAARPAARAAGPELTGLAGTVGG